MEAKKFTEPKNLGDLLIVAVAIGWTKQKLIFASGTNYPRGTVLAKVAGKVQALDPAGAGAAKVAWGIAAEPVDATDADRTGVVIARGATVDSGELVWPAGATEPQQAAALAELDARGIVAITPL